MVTFTGGERLAEKLRELSENVRRAASLKVGVMADATYPDGTSVALVAATNEFGQTRVHPNQPPRPFMRGTIAEHSGEWPEQIGKLLEYHNYDAALALEMAGQLIEGQVKMSIRNFTDPPLAPSTVAAKGHDKPLIESSLMLQSITHIVDDGEGGSA